MIIKFSQVRGRSMSGAGEAGLSATDRGGNTTVKSSARRFRHYDTCKFAIVLGDELTVNSPSKLSMTRPSVNSKNYVETVKNR